MKKLEWPGIATATAIILIFMIALDLSKWQTLAAALIAFGGGALAYRGAMAKIWADQKRDREELERRKLGLYLRVQSAARRMTAEAHQHRLIMGPRPADQYAVGIRRTIQVQDLCFEPFEEFEEAWKNLDLLPKTVSFNLDQIREVLKKDKVFLDGLAVAEVEHVIFVFSGHPLHPCDQSNEYLEAAGRAVISDLEREIENIRS